MTVTKNTEQTRSISFRIENNICNRLELDAKKAGISLNKLINQILKDYIDWSMFQPSCGLIPIGKSVVAQLFNKLSEGEVIQLAKDEGKTAITETALFMKGKTELGSFLSWLELRMKKCGSRVSHIITKDINGSHKLIVIHDLGQNWSLYNKVMLEIIFKETFNMKVDVQITDSMIILEV
jgi:hypothetical protein